MLAEKLEEQMLAKAKGPRPLAVGLFQISLHPEKKCCTRKGRHFGGSRGTHLGGTSFLQAIQVAVGQR